MATPPHISSLYRWRNNTMRSGWMKCSSLCCGVESIVHKLVGPEKNYKMGSSIQRSSQSLLPILLPPAGRQGYPVCCTVLAGSQQWSSPEGQQKLGQLLKLWRGQAGPAQIFQLVPLLPPTARENRGSAAYTHVPSSDVRAAWGPRGTAELTQAGFSPSQCVSFPQTVSLCLKHTFHVHLNQWLDRQWICICNCNCSLIKIVRRLVLQSGPTYGWHSTLNTGGPHIITRDLTLLAEEYQQ